jgi:hypothetical protein
MKLALLNVVVFGFILFCPKESYNFGVVGHNWLVEHHLLDSQVMKLK